VYEHLMQMTQKCTQTGLVLDLGGGTGIYRDVWKDVQLYISLDNDMQKAAGFMKNFSSCGVSLVADAANIPFKNNSVDIVQCTMVSHHLKDDLFNSLIEESHRVLKENGRLVFMDAFWLPQSIKSRLMWSLDRGSYPKSKETLLSSIERKFKIIEQKELQIHHSYLSCLGQKA